MRHLGDFAVDDHGVYLPRLKGKRLILGNTTTPASNMQSDGAPSTTCGR
jgi:hypothetical protein